MLRYPAPTLRAGPQPFFQGAELPPGAFLMAKPLLLVLGFALVTTLGWGYSTPPTGTTEPPAAQTAAPTEDETLQNEADNQENVLSQVGGEPPARSVCPSGGRSLKRVLLKRSQAAVGPSITEGEGFCFSCIRTFS